jgi:hypothetical protein
MHNLFNGPKAAFVPRNRTLDGIRASKSERDEADDDEQHGCYYQLYEHVIPTSVVPAFLQETAKYTFKCSGAKTKAGS